ncbi:MAG: WG repeat-containing protein [Bacteroidetes bacterium]|nr:WG repeat-containing protein [Bacteroidota bacterium]
MTLHLGEVLRQYSFASVSLVNEPNLLKIIRIPWFRTGIIPEEIREKLVDELSPEITRKVREEIHRILEANEPPPDSYAAEKRERQLTIQNWQLQPLSWVQKIQVGEKIEDMMDREEINDVTVLKYLKSQDDQRMTIPVPESWKEVIYKKGMPVLGLRSWVRWTVLLPIILLLLQPAIDFARKGHFQSIQDLKQLIKKPDNFVEIDGVYYKLDEATDSALYFAYLGNYSYWQGDFGPAYNRYTEAIQLNRFEPDYYYQRGLANYHLTRLAKVDSILLDTYKDFVRSVNLRPLFTSETKRRRDTVINLPVGSTGNISYDGQMILVSEGSSAKIYSRDSLKLLSSIPLGGVPRAMNWSKDGKYILSAVGNNGQIHEVQTGQKTARFEAHNYPINSIRFSPNGKYVITGAEDNLAIIWNRERGESKRPIHYLEHIHSGPILDVAFSPDNRFVATASADSTAGIWNSSTGQLEGYLLNHGFPVISVAFSPDSRSIMTASANGKIALWDLNGTKQFEKHILGETLSHVSFSADGSILMTLGEKSDHSSKTIGFYSFRYERPMVKIDVSEFQTYDDQPAFVSLSGDGNYLLLVVEDIGIMTYNFDPLTFESNLIRKYGQFNRSVINYERELFADAISDFGKLIKQDGQNLDAYYGRGLSYLYQAQTSSESLDTISFRLGIEDLKYIMSRKNNYFDSLPELLPFFFQFFSDYEGLEKYADDLCLITQMIDAGYCELFKYEQILPYSDGLAAVKNDELWGYIDSSRSLVIPFQYLEAYPFKNGLAKVKARVRKTSSQFQLINSRNEVVYVDIGNPAEGLQYVRSPRNGLFGYIDVETGEEIIKPVYETAEDFERGYAIVSVREQKELRYGLIDRNGSAGRYGGFIYSKIIGQFGRDNKISVVSVEGKSYELDYISPFGDQKAVEFTGDIEDFQEKRNLPNQSNLPYEIVGDLSNGLIRAQQGGKFGFVAQVKQMNPYVQQTQSSKVEAGLRNPEEQYVVIIPFQYTEAYDFSYERAGVKNADGIWGFIDTYGKVVIPYSYDHVDYFIKREDKILAQVEENKQTYYIDRAGNCISFGELTCPTPEMRTYSKNTKLKTYTDQETNLQVFEENGKWGLRDQDGKIIVMPKFDNQINFSENLARVSKDGKWGFIDRTGKEIIGFDFEGALDFSDGLAAVKQGSRWGYIDTNGKVQINFLFSAPGRFQNGWAIIKEGKVSFKIDKKGNKIGSRRN